MQETKFYSNKSHRSTTENGSFRNLNKSFKAKTCNRSNPCNVCGSTEPDCRSNVNDPDYFQCFNYQDARKKEVIQGYDGTSWICVSESGSSHAAGFKPYVAKTNYTPFTKEQKAQWRKEQLEKEAKRAEAQAKKISNELSLSDRQKYFSLLASKSPLTEEHREHLSDYRDLSDTTINKVGFFSLKPNHRVNYLNLPANFPGLRKDQTLNVTFTSVAIPIKNSQGEILAVELMPIPKRVSCKYVKLSCSNDNAFSGYNSEHYQGEIAISASFPDKPNKLNCDVTPVLLVEGRLKPIVAQEKHNIAYISISGGNFAGSPKGFKSEVDAAIKKYGAIKLVFTPDAGDVNNTQLRTNRENQINFISQIASELGIDFDILWWNQNGNKKKSASDKSINDLDIDELDNLDAVKFISIDELLANWKQSERKTEVVNLSPNLVAEVKTFRNLNETEKTQIESRLKSGDRIKGSYETSVKKSDAWLNWIEKNKYTPDVIIKGKGDLVLPTDFSIEGKNVFVKSGLGTNKTGSSLSYLTELEQEKDIHTILLSYINSLLHQTNNRAKQLGKDFVHIQSDDDGKLLAKDSKSNVSLCVHSLGYIDGHFSDRNVFVDEIESVLQTLVSGANLGKHQGDIIEMFFKGLKKSWGNLFTDGNVTDLLADLISKLTGKPVIKYEYQSETFRKKNFEFIVSLTKKRKIANNDSSAAIGRILADIRAGKKLFITTDSRVLGESVIENALKISAEEKAINAAIETVKEAGYKVFIVSKNTSGTDEGKKFLSNPSQYIIDNQIDLIVGTPSIGSGVSVILPDNFFDAQYTIFCGVLSTKQQKQLLARLRNNTLTHCVYCPVKSGVKDRNRPQQYSVTEFQQEFNQLQQLGKAISILEIENILTQAKSRVNALFDEYSATMGALDNFEQDNLLECLTYSLETEGHNVSLVFENHHEKAKEETKEAKTKIQNREAEEFLKAVPFESTLEAESVTKGNPTPQNHVRKSKTYFLDQLPGIDQKLVWSSEFILNYVIADSDQKFIKAITREFMLNNFDIAQEKHNLRMLNNAQKKHPVAKDLLPGDFGRIWALKQLKFDERVLKAEQFTCKSPFIQEMIAEYKDRKDLQKLLKIEVPTDKVIDISIRGFISPLLALLGYKTEENSKIKIDGVPYKAYKAISAIDEKDKTAIYDCITDKWVKWQEKHEFDKQLESHKIQEELEQQIKELRNQFNSALINKDSLDWDIRLLEKASIKDIREMMMLIEDQEMHDSLRECYSDCAWKAALSTLSQEWADNLANFGSPKMMHGVYEKLNFVLV
ncbi:hypothetical protein H6G64_35455 [Calothrix sp. FACHB-156]|nr:hypothetical protein [Calothrix sp. FACHB-156]